MTLYSDTRYTGKGWVTNTIWDMYQLVLKSNVKEQTFLEEEIKHHRKASFVFVQVH